MGDRKTWGQTQHLKKFPRYHPLMCAIETKFFGCETNQTSPIETGVYLE
jgi:hypothetical protein